MDPFVKTHHDALEKTRLASTMADGTVTPELYTRYLRDSLVIWTALEGKFGLARKLGVRGRVESDLFLMPPDPHDDGSVPWCVDHIASTCNEHDLYVLGLGLCYGGKQIARNISDHRSFPVEHFRMPPKSVQRLRGIRTTSSGLASAFHRTLAWYDNVT